MCIRTSILAFALAAVSGQVDAAASEHSLRNLPVSESFVEGKVIAVVGGGHFKYRAALVAGETEWELCGVMAIRSEAPTYFNLFLRDSALRIDGERAVADLRYWPKVSRKSLASSTAACRGTGVLIDRQINRAWFDWSKRWYQFDRFREVDRPPEPFNLR